ncbi:MAG: nucleoside triphosphate pyrophosphohydrolase [Syntrophus sp. (in: bacteria)]|nr:nucleoside triphosphate pyrophosphohydrolase [Syntrophus sp. (in: bacteria)]
MEEFSKLVGLLESLRGDKGCPWDKRQTVKEFKTYLLEEVYEIIDAIEKDDYKALQEELGDLLFHIVFIAQICMETGRFTIRDVISATHEKMYNRHPHVFKDGLSDSLIEKRWEEIKREEKADYSPLDDIPKGMPALSRAYLISKRASKTGFDWARIEDVYEKMYEEIEEMKNAGDSGAQREEIGDMLFTMVNIARFKGIDPEDALRYACDKFIRRFSYIGKRTNLEGASLRTMDDLWNEAKSIEKKGA